MGQAIEFLEILSLSLATIILMLTVFNHLTILQPQPGHKAISRRVVALIPMRNESRNARGVIDSALSQERLADFAVQVIDDGSTDGTTEILREISDPRFSWQLGGELPVGWLGKNYALHSLAGNSSGDYLVFIDADVRLARFAIADSIELMERRNLDYLCPYPRQIALSTLERLIQPLLQWSWFASLPLLFAERSLKASTVVANGQFFIVRANAYQAIGGHESIKDEVLDDMELARALRAAGYRGTVVDGSAIASCRMYESDSELISGYLKSQWRAFGGTSGAVFAILLLSASSLLPAVLTLTGSTIGIFCMSALWLSRIIVAVRVKSPIISSIFHPIAIGFWIYLIIRSIVGKRRNQLSWRGRKI